MDSPPVGGTTGLSHEHSAAVEEAAAWYRLNRGTFSRAAVPTLQERFGLSAREACEALALASRTAR